MKLLGVLIIIAFVCSGCAVTQIALEKKDLKVETQMSNTIFLDIENMAAKTVYVDFRNTSDKDIDVKSMLESKLKERGFTITATPKEAFYILQGNILYVGKADPSALRESLYAGYGGVLAGALGGAVIGHAAGSVGYGAGIGGLVGGAADLVAGSLVKDVTYTIVTDLMISEKSREQVEQTVKSDLQQGSGSQIVQTSNTTVDRKRYQTRVVSTANQVNLNLEEALPPLIENLSKSVSGIF
jgi:hypothetical protein